MSNKKKFGKDKLPARYRVAIIGAGRIAAGFDTPKSNLILTHAHAILKNPRTTLVGFVDTDKNAASVAARRWSTRFFSTIQELYQETSPEIVIVCTPDSAHYKVLKDLLRFHPRLVICEKPITTRLSDSKKIIAAYNQARIPLLINYSRRFDAAMLDFKTRLAQGQFGKVLWATYLYTKGVLHNGSHAIDLARWLFGEVTASQALMARTDYTAEDRTVGAFLTLARCPEFYLIPGDEKSYSVFELDIGATRGRVRFTDFGFTIESQEVESDPRYKGYRQLSAPKPTPTQLEGSLSALLSNALDHLDAGAQLICTGADALKTQIICLSLLTKASRLI